MKKWMFVIFPGILFLGFLFFYHQGTEAIAERERVHAEQAARQKADEAARKQMIENKARDDANKRAADQAAEDAKRDADKAALKAADRAKIKEDTEKDQAQVDNYTKQSDALQAEFDGLVKQEADESRADFELVKTVERARINRQNAALEIDRFVDMIAQRAERSSLTHPPVRTAPQPQ